MANGTTYLKEIKKKLEAGQRQWKRGDKILAAYGYVRRRQTFVDQINADLEALGLEAVPPITTDLDLAGYTIFRAKGESSPEDVEVAGESAAAEASAIPAEVVAEEKAERAEPPKVDVANPADLSLRVRNLECAEAAPVWITPDATVNAALTEMQLKDFSQLVVATKLNKSHVKGVISYKSIARASLLGEPKLVKDCVDATVPRVDEDEPLLDVVAHFKRHDIVLVFDSDNILSFVVTPADISSEFRNMAGPFLIIGEIEEHLRWLLERRPSLASVIAERLPSPPAAGSSGVSELTMGDVQWILQNPEHWATVGLKHDRERFCAELDHVRGLRNTVMHFRDPIAGKDLERLRSFADLLRAECSAAAKR